MIQDFLKANRTELIARCRAKAAKRAPAGAPPAESEFGIPQLLDQLIETFRKEQSPEAEARRRAGKPSLALVPSDIHGSAFKHGHELRRQGVTVDQVVHGYGDLCQAMTELALEKDVPISVDEFHTFNRCLDDAIADAVTSYVEEPPAAAAQAPAEMQRPVTATGQMGHLIESALQSFAAIQSGAVGTKGNTAALHQTSLIGLRDLIQSAVPQDQDRQQRPR